MPSGTCAAGSRSCSRSSGPPCWASRSCAAGVAMPAGDEQVRFFVFPAERTELVRLKLERSPWLRAEVERQNWHFLKWQHLDTLASWSRPARMAGAGAGPGSADRAGRRAADDVRRVTRGARSPSSLDLAGTLSRECRGSPLRHSQLVSEAQRERASGARASLGRPMVRRTTVITSSTYGLPWPGLNRVARQPEMWSSSSSRPTWSAAAVSASTCCSSRGSRPPRRPGAAGRAPGPRSARGG